MKQWQHYFLLGMTMLLGCSFDTAAYEDRNHVYSVTFPKGWKVSENDAKGIDWVTASSPAEGDNDPFLENIQITFNEKPSDTTLNEYVPEMISFMKEKYANISIEEMGSTTLAGLEAKWILFTANGLGKAGKSIPLKAIHYILVSDKHLMLILCVSPEERFERWKSTFEESLKTLQFNKTASATPSVS